MRCSSIVLGLLVAVVAIHGVVRAEPAGDAVALLPLDADKQLELYGQPVASELAHELTTNGIDVVVVGARQAVPERAGLIVDGRITAGKDGAVALSIRIRDRAAGTVLDTLSATAPSLTNIDAAAAELAARVLPAVKTRLANLHKPALVTPPDPNKMVATTPAEPPGVLIAVGAPAGGPAAEPLRVALAAEVDVWARDHHRTVKRIDVNALARTLAPAAVAKSGTDVGISIEAIALAVEMRAIPTARARVRVRIADATQVAFDRVIVTDTIVGDRGMSRDALVARCAREVLLIAQPYVRRAISTWR
jgi:hypothetical protein